MERKTLHIFKYALSENTKKIQHSTMDVCLDEGYIYEMTEGATFRPICSEGSLGQVSVYNMFPTKEIDKVEILTFDDTIDIEKIKEPFIIQLTEEITEKKKQLNRIKKLSL